MAINDEVSIGDWGPLDSGDDASCAPGEGDSANSNAEADDDLEVDWEEDEHTVAFMLDRDGKTASPAPKQPQRKVGRRQALQCLLDDSELDRLLVDTRKPGSSNPALAKDTAYEDEVTDPKVAPLMKAVAVSIPVDFDERPTLSGWRGGDDEPGS